MMRDSFIRAVSELAAEEPNIILLVGDIGFKVFDGFREKYGDRFINCGIAEANMVGMAAGLAAGSFRPIVYTIIPFLTMRAFEQIRVDICLHKLPVILVGVGGGLSYDVLGPTHHSIEDIALMRALPAMEVLVPSDPEEVVHSVRAAFSRSGPVYLRLGKSGEPQLGRPSSGSFRFGHARVLREGSRVAIFGCGPILRAGLEAADRLERHGISCAVVNFHSVKPLDVASVLSFSASVDAIAVLEEHSIIGGLGSAVAEVLAESNTRSKFKRFGISDRFTTEVGDREYLLQVNGVYSTPIVEWILSAIRT